MGVALARLGRALSVKVGNHLCDCKSSAAAISVVLLACIFAERLWRGTNLVSCWDAARPLVVRRGCHALSRRRQATYPPFCAQLSGRVILPRPRWCYVWERAQVKSEDCSRVAVWLESRRFLLRACILR